MTEKQAIKKTVKHWEKMIKWVKVQNPKAVPDAFEMAKVLKEDWFAASCTLCSLYHPKCNSCPLGIAEGQGCGTPPSWWRKVRNAKTWGAWLKYAEKLLKILKSL